MEIKQILDSSMPSLTEWMEKIGLSKSEEFRAEDNSKRDRLEILLQTIGLPYDKPERMSARDIVDKTEKFQDILDRKGDNKCALRLIPLKPELPKLRVRGKTLKDNLVWFYEQNVNPDDYKIEVVPHNETDYSAIFLINDKGIWGEITKGRHWLLTQGYYGEYPPAFFSFDFKKWNFFRADDQMKQIVLDAIKKLLITDSTIKEKLMKELQSEFTPDGYLKGYFEFVLWPDTVFIDYNRILYKKLNDFTFTVYDGSEELKGICANQGKASGPARVITDPKSNVFKDGDILICDMTGIEYVSLMKMASAIITEQGGILSHAAIIARELNKPCLVGVKEATKKFKDDQLIEVDADTGIIKNIS